jgi:hypothetical protein
MLFAFDACNTFMYGLPSSQFMLGDLDISLCIARSCKWPSLLCNAYASIVIASDRICLRCRFVFSSRNDCGSFLLLLVCELLLIVVSVISLAVLTCRHCCCVLFGYVTLVV